MTLVAVRKALTSIVRGTTGLTTARGLPASFAAAPETGDRDRPGDARRFYFVVDAMAGRGPYTPGAVSNRRVDTMRLVVSYPADVEDAALEDAISADYDALTARLLDSALWASTPIVDVTAYGPALLPAAIEADGRGVTLTITLTVEHIR
jgi:hypothetical protein